MTLIFINPGHSYNGKPDAGACYHGKRECDVAALIGKSLATALSKYENVQTQVYQQYDDPGLVPANKRGNSNAQLNAVCKKANIVKADYFVSIHLNALNEQSKGTETLYAPGSTWGKVMAESVHAELLKTFGTYAFSDRKIKTRADLAVLKYTNMPAILIEVGFISNKHEIEFICYNIDAIADRIAKGLAKALSLKIKASTEATQLVNSAEYKLVPSSGKYNLFKNDKELLHENRLETCLAYLQTHEC